MDADHVGAVEDVAKDELRDAYLIHCSEVELLEDLGWVGWGMQSNCCGSDECLWSIGVEDNTTS